MRTQTTIKGFILGAALLVSVVLFGGIYAATSQVYDNAVRESALTLSNTLAQGTFNAMFQIMRRGWTRPQLEEFIASIRAESNDSPYNVTIYRGPIVEQRFGPIAQPPLDALIEKTFHSAEPQNETVAGDIRYTYPLKARDECLRCHTNASVGNVLGVIEVRQPLQAVVSKAQSKLLPPLLFIAPLPFIAALLVAMFLNRRIKQSLDTLQSNIDAVNHVADLTNIELKPADLGFAELNAVFSKIEELAAKLRSVAVDKDLLEFEIRLLEKFVITSEVVRDWREYVSYLMIDINKVIQAYILFSIFKVDDELFDLEVFWIRPPTDGTRHSVEEAVQRIVKESSYFSDIATVTINHNVAYPDGEPIELDESEVDLQTKALFVDTPKIGGIVGIGVHAALKRDEMRMLVIESILSTLLNVVGSVKAIYKYTKDLEFYATRDPLTNLYNQRLFWEMLGYEVNRAERHQYQFALMMIDLDNFKAINDSYGHAFGDRFLQEFAACVHNALRSGDVLARYGGDEFVVVLPESGSAQSYTVAERVLANSSELALEAPDGTRVKATVSIGMGIYPDHAQDPKDLFLFADNMMYKAKTGGKNRIGFPTDEDVVEVFRSIGEKSIIIANAIEQRSIVPYFQPILDVERNEIIAFEVLSRIQLEDNQILGAHEFIEIAEKTGVIHQVDYIVMDKAFEHVRSAGYQGQIFINLSPRALVLNEFIPEVRRLTHAHGIAPSQVVFEITERDTVKNITLLERFVNDLKLEGFGLAIDDFGSGFSSFHYLKRFPIDYVKIEGDFIVNMSNDPRDRAFVHSIAELARQLGIKALAEYVENAEVMHSIREAGIAYAQGFYIGRPAQELVTTLPQALS